VCRHHAELPVRSALVGSRHPGHGVVGVRTRGEQLEHVVLVGHFRHRLGRDRTDPDPGGRHDRPDGDEPARHGNAERITDLAGDGERHELILSMSDTASWGA
jgi:hypothetical protein